MAFPISCLPDELLLQIFAKLSPVDWCRSLAGVDRRWNKLANDVFLWRRVDFGAHLDWIDFAETFLGAKLAIQFYGACHIKVSALNQQRICLNCLISGLKKLVNAASSSIVSIDFGAVDFIAEESPCDFHDFSQKCGSKSRMGFSEFYAGLETPYELPSSRSSSELAGDLAEILCLCSSLESLTLPLGLNFAVHFLSYFRSKPRCARIAAAWSSVSLVLTVEKEEPEEVVRLWRVVDAELLRWNNVRSLVLPSLYTLFSYSFNLEFYPNLDRLTIEVGDLGNAFVPRYFIKSESASANLTFLDITLTGQYSMLGVLFKGCAKLLSARIQYQYKDNSSSRLIMENENPFDNISRTLQDFSFVWLRGSILYEFGVGERIALDIAASASALPLPRLSLTSFDVAHLSAAIDAFPGVSSKLVDLLLGFASPDSRQSWKQLRAIVSAARRLRRFSNSSLEGNRFPNHTAHVFDFIKLDSMRLFHSVFALLPAFPNVVDLRLPTSVNGDKVIKMLEGRTSLKILHAPNLHFNKTDLADLASATLCSLTELYFGESAGLAARENVPVFLKEFHRLVKAVVFFDLDLTTKEQSSDKSASASGRQGADTNGDLEWWNNLDKETRFEDVIEKHLASAFPRSERIEMIFNSRKSRKRLCDYISWTVVLKTTCLGSRKYTFIKS